MISRREKKKIYEFSLIISLESLINQSVWGWGGVLSVTMYSVCKCFSNLLHCLFVCQS